MEVLMEILQDARPDVDYANEKSLVTGGVFDSFDIILLVDRISEEFDITIRPSDLRPENFNSADAMMALIERRLEEE